MRWTVALGFLSTVAPITLLLTFFGINAREVDSRRFMFSPHYWPMYTALALLVVAGLALSAGSPCSTGGRPDVTRDRPWQRCRRYGRSSHRHARGSATGGYPCEGCANG